MPDKNFEDRVIKIINETDIAIIVDNTPGCYAFSHEFIENKSIIILQDGQNKGLGKALNLGILYAKANQCDTAILFDQDSSPSSCFIKKLLTKLNEFNKKYNYKCCIGPVHIDDNISQTSKKINSRENNKSFIELSAIPTSGMAFSLKKISSDDLFTEDFFLDFVDFEWCWRIRTQGWRIFRIFDITMPHRLGISQKKFLGITYYISAPYRHYFQFRESLKILHLNYVPFYPKFRYLLIRSLDLIIVPVTENNGKERLKWMILGIIDYFKSKNGVGSAQKKLCDLKS